MSPKDQQDKSFISGYRVRFHPHFREDLLWWVRQDKKVVDRIWNLIADILDGNPFVGIGKPEPLKYDVSNTWLRRITQEHRLVYRVEKQTVYFTSNSVSLLAKNCCSLFSCTFDMKIVGNKLLAA